MENRVYLLPVWDTITTAWEKVHGAKKTFWASLLLLALIMFGLGIVEGIFEALPGIPVMIRALSNAITYLINVSLIYIGIKRAQNLPINYKMMFHAFHKDVFLRIAGLFILQALILAIPAALAAAGYGLLIAGNIIFTLLGISLLLASYIASIVLLIRIGVSVGFVMDQQLNPWHAIKSSFAATRGNFWNLVGLFLLQLLIATASAIPLGIGLIWTIPLCLITYGVIYQRLRQNA